MGLCVRANLTIKSILRERVCDVGYIRKKKNKKKKEKIYIHTYIHTYLDIGNFTGRQRSTQ